MTTEYATVCAHYGKPGHTRHLVPRHNLAKATQAAIDANHHAEIHSTLWYADEAPWVVMTREVSPWVPATPEVPDNQEPLFDAPVSP